MKLLSTITAAVVLAALNVFALDQENMGCYEAGDGKFTKKQTDGAMSSGKCLATCVGIGAPLAAMGGGIECFCGTMLPSLKVDAKKCNRSCPGYGDEQCGSIDGSYQTIWLTGVGKVEPRPKTSTTSSSPTSKPSSSDNPDSPSSSDSASPTPTEEPKKSSGVSKAGAAAGAVVGVLAFAAIIGGGILFYKRRRQQQVEEEYRRTLAVQSFGKKPEADHRLEPVMLQRRASDGSIADNEDYSRRILKVTNPDG